MGFGIDYKKEPERLWKKGIIPYRYETGQQVDQILKSNIRKAMNEWESQTKVLFVEVQPNDSTDDIPVIIDVSQASSSNQNQWSSGIQKNGKNPQADPTKKLHHRLTIKSADSSYGSLLHELGHVLGLAHEQDRDEPAAKTYRDDVLTTQKKLPYIEEVFQLVKTKNYRTYGNFDQDSIMLYGYKGKPKAAVSKGDAAAILEMYEAAVKARTTVSEQKSLKPTTHFPSQQLSVEKDSEIYLNGIKVAFDHPTPLMPVVLKSR